MAEYDRVISGASVRKAKWFVDYELDNTQAKADGHEGGEEYNQEKAKQSDAPNTNRDPARLFSRNSAIRFPRKSNVT